MNTSHTIYTHSGGEPFWGNTGAGVLLQAQDTGRFLVGLRSEYVNEPGTWGVFGGAIDANETPIQAVAREVQEELGYTGQIALKEVYVFSSPGGFRYHNFIGIVPFEFLPTLNWETTTAAWLTLQELQSLHPKHFGLTALLDNLPHDIFPPPAHKDNPMPHDTETVYLENQIRTIKQLIKEAPAEDKKKLREIVWLLRDRIKRLKKKRNPPVHANPYPNEHAARVHDPELFRKDTFRSKTIAPGIRIILAKLKKTFMIKPSSGIGSRKRDPTVVQAFRFKNVLYTPAQARAWLKKHGVIVKKFEPATASQAQSRVAASKKKRKVSASRRKVS